MKYKNSFLFFNKRNMCSSNSCCCICLNKIPISYPTLSCGHKIHPKCMRRWNKACPLCRKNVNIIPKTRAIQNAHKIYNDLDLIISPLKLNCYDWKFSVNRSEKAAENIWTGICTLSAFVWEHRCLLRRNDLLILNIKKRVPTILLTVCNIKGEKWCSKKENKKIINKLKKILDKI